MTLPKAVGGRALGWNYKVAIRDKVGLIMSMKLKLTAVFQKFPEGYAAFVEELPGANTQGATLVEARANLAEAVVMVLEANRQLAEEELRGQEVIREPLALA